MATNMSGASFSFDDFIRKPAVELGDITILAAEIRRQCFAESKLGHVNAPNLTFLNDGAFASAKLTSIYAPLATGAGANCFDDATGIQYIVLPSLKVCWSYAFRSASLIAADFGGTPGTGEGFIRSNVFGANFATLVLRANAVFTLVNVNTFNGSKFAIKGSGGTLYVPSALISAYESDGVWGTLLGYANNSIKAIEGSEYETHYVDGSTIGS